MQLTALFICVVCAAAANGSFVENLDQQWTDFKRVFGKEYDGPEEAIRRALFEQRVNGIIQHNLAADLGLRSYRMGLNAFADQDRRELENVRQGRLRNASVVVSTPGQQLPDTVDWRERGAVTPVRDQGQCSAPWAFSAVGALEGQNQIKTGNLVVLSVQNLIDCVPSQGGSGCSGSMLAMNAGFKYVQQNGGIDTEASYPTTGQAGNCRFRKEGVGATCSGFVDLPTADEEALKQAVATVGPISTFIDASHEGFQLYVSGVYDDPQCTHEMDHAVLIVGYGTEYGKDYWLVKNSWGSKWGMNGYIKMARNKDNQCGIASIASYPLP